MIALLVDVLGPVAVIVALGAVIGPRYRIDPDSLSRLAYRVLGPAFMFDILHDADLELSTVAQLIVAGLAGMAAAMAVAVAALRLGGERRYSILAAGAMTSAYGNVGNAGLAISSFALGEDALPIAGVFMLAINVTGIMLGVGLAHGRTGSPLGALAQALSAPMTVASAVAIAVNAVDWTPPLVVARSVGLVAGALIPVMLFTLGVQLRRSARFDVNAATLVPVVAKLVVAPLAAWFVAGLIGLNGDALAVTTIQSAMPPAVFCMVVAMEHDFESEVVTATVALATLASALTLPVVLLALA